MCCQCFKGVTDQCAYRIFHYKVYIYADRTYTIFPVQSLKATVWSHPEDPSVQELLLELGVLERQEPLFSLVGNMTIRTIWIL